MSFTFFKLFGKLLEILWIFNIQFLQIWEKMSGHPDQNCWYSEVPEVVHTTKLDESNSTCHI